MKKQTKQAFVRTYRMFQYIQALKDSVQRNYEMAPDANTYYALGRCKKVLLRAWQAAERAANYVPQEVLPPSLKRKQGDIERKLYEMPATKRVAFCRAMALELLTEVAREAGGLTINDPQFTNLVGVEEFMGMLPRILEEAYSTIARIR